MRLLKHACACALVTCAAFPYRFETGAGLFATVSVLDFAFLISTLVVVVSACRRGHLSIGHRGVAIALALAPLLAFCSLLWAVDFRMALKAVTLYAYALALYIVVVNLLDDAPARFTAGLFSWFAIVVLMGALFLYLRVPGFDLFAAVDSPVDLDRIAAAYARFSHPFIGLSNDFAPILAFTLFAILGFGRLQPRLWDKPLAAVLAIGLFLTFSRGVLIGFLLVSLAYWTGSRFNLRLLAKALVVSMIVGAAVYVFTSRYAFSVGERQISGRDIVIDRLSNPGTVGVRAATYRTSLALVWRRPLLGYGTGIFDPDRSGQLSGTSHSTYLQQLLFYGVPLGMLSSLAWIVLAHMFWKWNTTTGDTRRFAKAVGAALAVILIAAASETFMEATVPRLLIYLLVGMSTALLNASDASVPEAAVR